MTGRPLDAAAVAGRGQTAGQVLMVDWLGRGGIAHCTEAWVRECRSTGATVELVTRRDRELEQAVPGSHGAGRGGGALVEHLAVVAAARRAIYELEPQVVILHGTVLPQVEWPLVRAARRCRSAVILVAHEASPPTRVVGSRSALTRLVRAADAVVVHSRYVGDQIRAMSGRSDCVVLPLPLQVGLLSAAAGAVPVVASSPMPLALLFGHLHRDYKGVTVIGELASGGVDGWRFALVGKGAPESLPGAVTVPRFLGIGELAATVAGSASTVLPYRRASQSGAVVLAQAVGSVVVASAVGGLPEQVTEGVTGRLLPAGAEVAQWRDVLLELRDPVERNRLATEARASVNRAHVAFAAGVLSLVGLGR